MLYGVLTVLILVLDQWVKFYVNSTLPLNEAAEFIPGILNLRHIHNYGAAFGILEGWRWPLVAIVVVFSAFVIYLMATKRIDGVFGKIVCSMILAGAIGNGIDRAIFGYVVDMFEFTFINFYIFNVADAFLVVGGILFCFYIIFHKPKKPEGAGDVDTQRVLANALNDNEHQPVANIEAIEKPVVTASEAMGEERVIRQRAPEERQPDPRGRKKKPQPDRRPEEPRRKPQQSPVTEDSVVKDYERQISKAAQRHAADEGETRTVPTKKIAERQSVPSDVPVSDRRDMGDRIAPPKPRSSDDEFSLESILAEFGED